jgi:hypothetical protein
MRNGIVLALDIPNQTSGEDYNNVCSLRERYNMYASMLMQISTRIYRETR